MSATSMPPLERLQKLLDEKNLAAYIVPSADAHQSEYVAACDKHREYISGFSGSAGTVVILNTHFQNQKHRLWTDGRYYLQAIQQLDGEKWMLMKQGQTGVPKLEEWCITTFPSGSRIGIDPTVMSIAQWRAYHDTLTHAGMELVTLPNLVETVWENRPSRPHAPITVLPISYTGMSTATKVEQIRKSLVENKIHALVITALDEVAWIFNLRGADIPFNPVFFAYALITQELVRLYVDSSQLTTDVLQHLGSAVDVKPYQAILSDLKAASSLLPIADPKCNRIWMDPTKCNYAIYSTVSSEYVYEAQSPISLMKAIKNPIELNGMRQAHIRDAAAVCNFLNWLEENIGEEKQEWNEVTVADRLEQFRTEQKDYIGLSFETISASGASGAIIHYKPELSTCKKVDTQHMYLCDSGAQYRDGTTDITRTIHLGAPSRFETIAFTRVLQGHIGLASVVFPPDTVGPNLDAFARAPLWSSGLDYQHGTGHGVGHYLNVHEGPHGISSSTRTGSALVTPLQAGMVVTNEPGYYHEGSFGIRIESVLIVKNATTENQFLGKQFMEFETITMVPIQRKLIAIDLLTDREIAWLNQFHVACRTLVSPLLSGNALKWLHDATQPITRPVPVVSTTSKPTDAPTKYY